MTKKQQVKSFLQEKPGYQKIAYAKIAAMFQTNRNLVKEVIQEINSTPKTKEDKYVKIIHPVSKAISTIDKEDMVANKFDYQSFLEWKRRQENTSKDLDTVEAPEPFKEGIHLVSGCNHVPFHNKEMLRGMLRLIQDLDTKMAGLHLIGDFLDLNSLSAHDYGKVPIQGITLGKEYKEGNNVLNQFESALGRNYRKIDKTFIYGNHEDRYKRHISQSDNNKYADALISPETALNLEDRGYKVLTNWKDDHHLLGKHLQLIHGEYCSKSPARAHMDKLKSSVMFAHTHRVDIVYDGEKAGFNIGWGGDKDAPAFGYVSRITKLNWINGFALVQIDKEGNFHTQVIPVYKNKFWYNGKCY